ncbi:MAG TPA: hypothetical protein VGS21_08465 [Acidimicrobiales bacterium]|nr:hypothetical protein [Acidimicrobiales bacterium]
MSYRPDDVDRLLASDFMSGIGDAPMEDLRRKRDECQRAEAALSYVRRLLQGRLDIIEAEVLRRSAGTGGDVSQLIDRLPEILASPVAVAQPQHRSLATLPGMAAGLSDAFDVDLSSIEGVQEMASNLTSLADDELHAIAERIRASEAQVSTKRRAVHELIDEVQAQIVARYKSGEANVEELLQQRRGEADSS